MISIRKENEHLYRLSGTLEHFESIKSKDVLEECLKSANQDKLKVDISELQSVSSITLSFLLFGLRAAKEQSRELHYQNMPPALFNMARVSGIENILVS